MVVKCLLGVCVVLYKTRELLIHTGGVPTSTLELLTASVVFVVVIIIKRDCVYICIEERVTLVVVKFEIDKRQLIL